MADFGDLGHPGEGDLAGTPGIGIIGAGWIVRECHLPAYLSAGAEVKGVTSRTPARSEGLAEASGIAAFDDWEALVDEPSVEVIDLAYPPDVQPGLIRAIVERDAGIRGILAQKPLGATLEGAREAVEACEEHGVVLGVNQNMRYDHSIRALKSLLEEGRLGDPVMAQITMHTRVGWMPYADEYPRKGMLIMSIHHLDAFRFLFGDPESVTTTVRANPDAEDEVDEMAVYTLAYPDGLLAVAIDNTYATLDQGIEWRVDGSGGMAGGRSAGWTTRGGAPAPCATSTPSSPTPRSNRAGPNAGSRTRSRRRWPRCCGRSQSGGTPSINGRDNLRTMALLEAAYRSAEQGRTVALSEVEV